MLSVTIIYIAKAGKSHFFFENYLALKLVVLRILLWKTLESMILLKLPPMSNTEAVH